jgi:hypothetical protein
VLKFEKSLRFGYEADILKRDLLTKIRFEIRV